jgi:hypothetical protein
MLHVAGEASFEAETSEQSRCCAGSGRRTGSIAGGKRVRIRDCDCGRSAISEHLTQSTLRSERRGNSGRESCYILCLRQGERPQRLDAGGARRLRRLRSWWRLRRRWWMSRLRWRRWMSRWWWLWLQRLRLRRLRRRLGRRLGRFWRLRLWRLLPVVGWLPLLLSRRCSVDAVLAHRQNNWWRAGKPAGSRRSGAVPP